MKLTKKAIEKMIISSSGLISTIAQKLKLSRGTIRNYFKKYPEQEELRNEEAWAIKYFLTSQGTHRGYRSNASQIEQLKRQLGNSQFKLGADFHCLVEGAFEEMELRN